jgi:hypothetical protein
MLRGKLGQIIIMMLGKKEVEHNIYHRQKKILTNRQKKKLIL